MSTVLEPVTVIAEQELCGLDRVTFGSASFRMGDETETPVKDPPAPPKPDTDEPSPGIDDPPAEPAPGPDEYPDGNPCEPGPCRW